MLNESLQGKFILSSSVGDSSGGVFKRSVVYIVEHNELGSYGVIVNKVLPNSSKLLSGALRSYDESNPSAKIFLGGPLSSRKLHVLYILNGRVVVSSNRRIIEGIFLSGENTPCKFVLGYAAWGAGDIYNEIKNHYWHVLPATNDYIFCDGDCYKSLKNEHGLNSAFLVDACGNS